MHGKEVVESAEWNYRLVAICLHIRMHACMHATGGMRAHGIPSGSGGAWEWAPQRPAGLLACPGEEVWVNTVGFLQGRQGALTPRELPPKIGWTFSPSAARRARPVVPRGRWVYEEGSFRDPPREKREKKRKENLVRSPRVSRHLKSVGLSRPPQPGAHDSSCREVGGYIREVFSRCAHPA